MRLRDVLVAAVITGFLLGAAEIQGHGTTPPRGTAHLFAPGR
ncbi:hypothetical protein ABZV67_25805 [Streptomyces sp. NPDC005065]